MPALVSTLQTMAATHDVTPLLRYLLPHLVLSIFSSGETSSSAPPHTCNYQLIDMLPVTGEKEAEPETDMPAVFESILKSVPLTKGLDQTVAR